MIFLVLRKIYTNEALQNKISEPDLSFEKFVEIFQSTLDAFAP